MVNLFLYLEKLAVKMNQNICVQGTGYQGYQTAKNSK